MTGSAVSLLPPEVRVLERGWLSANNVVLLGDSEAAVVDSGYCSHEQQTLALIEQALGGRSLTLLANTHLHSDHCGGNAALQARYPELRTLIPPGLAAAVRDWDEVALTYRPTGQTCPRFRHDGLLQPGTTIRLGAQAWQVWAAPGHDPHSVVLFEPGERILMSADALWENGFGVVFPELEGEQAFAEVADTLDVIEGLSPRVVIPGHGPVFMDVRGALERARSRLRAYRADPLRHANHAAKVLLKFKLLELQRVPATDFLVWAEGTPCLQLVHRRLQDGSGLRAWIEQLIGELARSGAVRADGGDLLNA